jgi:hypothetical protein
VALSNGRGGSQAAEYSKEMDLSLAMRTTVLIDVRDMCLVRAISSCDMPPDFSSSMSFTLILFAMIHMAPFVEFDLTA